MVRRGQKVRRAVRERLEEVLARGGAAFFLTLNPVMDSIRDLRGRITTLLRDWAKIRNRKAWRHPVSGFQAQLGLVFALEVGEGSGLGHPHLHVLLWGQDPALVGAASDWVKKAWCGLNPTADPHLQALARVEGDFESIKRLVAYLTKGTRISTGWPISLILAVVEELSSGRRHLVRCGLARGRRLVLQKVA